MTKSDCKTWLDKVVDNAQERIALERFNKDIALCSGAGFDRVHIYSGILALAESVGAEVTEETEYSETYPYAYSFTYRGIHFFHLLIKRLSINDQNN